MKTEAKTKGLKTAVEDTDFSTAVEPDQLVTVVTVEPGSC